MLLQKLSTFTWIFDKFVFLLFYSKMTLYDKSIAEVRLGWDSLG